MQESRASRQAVKNYRKIYDLAAEEAKEIEAFERQKKRKRIIKRKRRNRRLITLTLIVMIIVYFALPISKIQTIVPRGNTIIPNNIVISESGLVENSSFKLLVNNLLVGRRFSKNPFIQTVTVVKKNVGQVELIVEERPIIFKTFRNEVWYAYFSNGTYAEIPANYFVAAANLIEIPADVEFDFAGLAKELAIVPSEIVEAISEIKYAPNDLETERYIFYMEDGNRINILRRQIGLKLKWYYKLVEQSDGYLCEYIMEYTEESVICRKINY